MMPSADKLKINAQRVSSLNNVDLCQQKYTIQMMLKRL